PPAFTSLPVVTGYVNTLYSYPLTAVDPDGQAVTFALGSGPAGMTYDPATRRLLWTPTGAQFGVPHAVQVTATDPLEASATQAFEINLEPEPGDHAPQITTQPSGTAVTSGQTFRYDVDAIDPDPGDTLTYRLIGSPPANMQIDSATGLI